MTADQTPGEKLAVWIRARAVVWPGGMRNERGQVVANAYSWENGDPLPAVHMVRWSTPGWGKHSEAS